MRAPRPKAPLLRAAELGLAHALLLILAFPPVFFPLAALLIPLPALLATRIEDKPRRAALVFGLATAPAWVFFHRWLIDVTLVGYPLLVLLLCLYPALFVVLARRAARALPWWIAAPLAWTAVEFFRGQIAFDGYPWYLTAQPLAALGVFSQLQHVGVYGVGGLVALATAGACVKPLRTVVIAAFGALASLILLPPISSGRSVPIAVVQTNVPQDNKTDWTIRERIRDFQRFVDLTLEAAAGAPRPALIVWPETMFPGPALDPESLVVVQNDPRLPAFDRALFELQREIGIPILVGAQAREGFRLEETPLGPVIEADASYNSAFLIRDGQPEPERYDKLQLTPFGEVMPYISWSDWLESRFLAIGAPGMSFDLDAGETETVFSAGDLLFATPICFEGTMPDVCRRLAYENGERRVHALIQLTNDGWFGDFAGGRETHALLARCRAIELGVSVVRAANTGVSTAYSPRGDSLGTLPPSTDGVLTIEVQQSRGHQTLYGAFLGDAPAWIALLGTLTATAFSFRRKKPAADPAPPPETAA